MVSMDVSTVRYTKDILSRDSVNLEGKICSLHIDKDGIKTGSFEPVLALP